jgi:hypothetical protein
MSQAYDKAYYAAHREEIAISKKAYHAAHREEKKAYDKTYYATYGKERKNSYLFRKYGLSGAAFDAMLKGQGETCAVCGTTKWGKHGPVVDHSHGIMKIVRGLLCVNCNLALGFIHDNPEIAQRMVDYLKESQEGRKA